MKYIDKKTHIAHLVDTLSDLSRANNTFSDLDKINTLIMNTDFLFKKYKKQKERSMLNTLFCNPQEKKNPVHKNALHLRV